MRFKENPTSRHPTSSRPDSRTRSCTRACASARPWSWRRTAWSTGQPEFQGVSLALDVTSEAEADRLFNALGEGGKVQMPIGKTFFSPRFGVVSDRFGVSWMVVTTPTT